MAKRLVAGSREGRWPCAVVVLGHPVWQRLGLVAWGVLRRVRSRHDPRAGDGKAVHAQRAPVQRLGELRVDGRVAQQRHRRSRVAAAFPQYYDVTAGTAGHEMPCECNL